MQPSPSVESLLERDRRVWDGCARRYERRIVTGHPDVLAYLSLEEDFLDRLLIYLARDCGRDLLLFDVGCGSGRLHIRYGLMTGRPDQPESQGKLTQGVCFEPILAERLKRIEGLDFSSEMLEIAKSKARSFGLESLIGDRLFYTHGSAFDLPSLPADPLPVAVSVCNSVGVMQGRAGADKLFSAMARLVAEAGGISLISGYRKDAIISHALGNYESTMEVSGQPRWLQPSEWATGEFVLSPRYYKRAYDPSPDILVDVFDSAGGLVQQALVLTRDTEATEKTVETGEIRTFTDYESNWYSWDDFEHWMASHWPESDTYHLAGSSLDRLRGAPAQFALVDYSGLLGSFLEKLNIARGG